MKVMIYYVKKPWLQASTYITTRLDFKLPVISKEKSVISRPKWG